MNATPCLPQDCDASALLYVESVDIDLTQLDDETFQRFVKQVLSDVARQRRRAQAWHLPTLVLPERGTETALA